MKRIAELQGAIVGRQAQFAHHVPAAGAGRPDGHVDHVPPAGTGLLWPVQRRQRVPMLLTDLQDLAYDVLEDLCEVAEQNDRWKEELSALSAVPVTGRRDALCW